MRRVDNARRTVVVYLHWLANKHSPGEKIMIRKLFTAITVCLLAMSPVASHAEDTWIKTGTDGKPEVQLYFDVRGDDAGTGRILLLAPERISQVGIAFGLMAVTVGVTWVAARLTGTKP